MAKNVNAKGRNSEPRHIRLYHRMTGSSAWQDLSGNAVKLLIAIMRLDNGESNGELFLSVRKGAEAIGVAVKTAGKAFEELQTHGFIEATEVGSYRQYNRQATKWRLTWLPMKGRGPTNDFERWHSIEASRGVAGCNSLQGQNLPVTVVDSAKPLQRRSLTMVETTTLQRASPSNPSKRQKGKTTTQVVYHGDSTAPVTMSAMQCNELRLAARAWLASAGIPQRHLARLSGLSESKLSRFLDPRGGKLLISSDFGRLASVVDFEKASPRKLASGR
ncbi:putative RNA binding protein YcfA (HicA-like mRNA interferase family) [Sphingobium xanthum]|uniref:hypothetical protein n=1 Tax=Sphingobium xanthum TaxID=1387165 RepID=UPI001C8CA2B4|nr:hypothetical protein [Sphingobium xanthum]